MRVVGWLMRWNLLKKLREKIEKVKKNAPESSAFFV